MIERMLEYDAVFKALGDRNRVRVVNLLLWEKRLCGCEFMEALELPQYEVSRHLAVLRRAGLVSARKKAKWVYFSLSQEPDGLRSLWGLLRRSFGEDVGLARDAERMKARVALREGGMCVVGNVPQDRLARRPWTHTAAVRRR